MVSTQALQTNMQWAEKTQLHERNENRASQHKPPQSLFMWFEKHTQLVCLTQKSISQLFYFSKNICQYVTVG